jgi:DNA polymerase-3 subunit gamma/tau
MIAEDSNTSVLRDALTQVVGGDWKIAVENGTAATLPETTASTRSARPASQAGEAEPDPRDDGDDLTTETSSAADPETEALKLLKDELGARPVD